METDDLSDLEEPITYNVGEKVHIRSYRHSLKPRPGIGTVVHIFKAGVKPDSRLILEYYFSGTTHKDKQYLRFCQTLKTDRVVIQRDNTGGHLILPTPSLFLIRKAYVSETKQENDQGY